MKHITLFEAYTKKTTCEKCDHSWKIEKEDKHPYLCHTCGYDSKGEKFNPKELERFWRNYEVND